ncbi:MAG TPA: DUF4139 domain-containing protein [Polyangiaceae bacterium]|nr:DUF4139 domain-containing protein [Polyangiaceae bacterium]
MSDVMGSAERVSRIDAVTVYRQGARVTRSLLVERTEQGYPEQVIFDALPMCLEDGSLTVRVTPLGASPAELPVASALKVALAVPAANPELRPAESAALRAARLQLKKQTELYDQCQREVTALAALQMLDRGRTKQGPPPPSPVAQRLGLLAFRTARAEELARSTREAAAQLQLAKKQLARLEDEEARRTSARNLRPDELAKRVIVELTQHHAATPRVRVSIEYHVRGARWAPAYTLSLDAQGRAELGLRALLRQRTGEDWKGVALQLSTADATRQTALPELPQLLIGRAQRPARRGFRPLPDGLESLFEDYDRARAAAFPAAATEFPNSRQGLAVAAAGGAHAAAAHAPPPPARPPAAPPAPVAAPAPAPAPEAFRMLAAQRELAEPQPVRRRRTMSAEPPRLSSMAGESAPPASLGAAPFGAPGALPDAQAGADLLQPEPELSLSDAQLDYGSLRMPGPLTPQRGRLGRASRLELYAEYTHVDVVVARVQFEQVALSVKRARELESSAPPSGYVYPNDDVFPALYAAEQPVDVTSDDEFHTVEVCRCAMQAALEYVAVPREAPHVFRQVTGVNPLPGPLLEGPIDVYMDGQYAMSSRLRTTPPGGKIQLGLGVEQRIKVARNTTYTEETGGLLRGHLDLLHGITIDLQSHLNVDVRVQIRERIPVTRPKEEELRVTLQTVEPAWRAYEEQTPPIEGAYAWHITLPASGKTSLKVRYAVRVPSKSELVGGNRREG